MQKIINIIYISVITTCLTACIKKVEINIPYEGDKITMYSYIKQDSNVYARLYKSARQGSFASFPVINNANVSLFENGVQVATLTYINNANVQDWYLSNYKAKPYKTYTLKATAPNLPNAEGVDNMVAKPNYKIDDFYKVAGQSVYEDRYYLKFTLNDPTVENYYQILVYKADTSLLPTGPRYKINYNEVLNYYVKNLAENESPFEAVEASNYRDLYFSDVKFNGKNVGVKLEFYGYNFQTNLNNIKVALVVKSISKSYYRYLTSAENQNLNSGSPFSEPSQIYTNVTGGYGIVATTADSVLFKRL